MKGDELIRLLADDLRPVRRTMPPWAATCVWFGLALLVVSAGVIVSHTRPDLHDWVARTDVRAELVAAGMTSVLAAFSGFQLAIPGRRSLWIVPPLLAATAWLTIAGAGCLHDFQAGGEVWSHQHADLDCIKFIVGFGTPVLLITLFLARHALLSSPLPVTLLAALAAAGAADVGLVVADHPHAAAATLIWHGGAALILMGIGTLIGSAWMRRTIVWAGLGEQVGPR